MGDLKELADRFWPKVRITAKCWEWKGSLKPNGYGQVSFNGKPISTHIASLMLIGVEVAKEHCVDHICKNRKCVRVPHLRVVTRRENAVFNSDSTAAKNALKTHCPKGHPYNKENTYVRVDRKWPHRRCRACIADYRKRNRKRRSRYLKEWRRTRKEVFGKVR